MENVDAIQVGKELIVQSKIVSTIVMNMANV